LQDPHVRRAYLGPLRPRVSVLAQQLILGS
jgi:hypothetical protein